MERVESLRKELREILNQSAAWFSDLPSHGFGDPALADDLATLAGLQHRAASALINVALIGGYSSGKTFLASGLLSKLEYEEVPTDDGVAAKYVGVLPSASRPTTACPATVIPVADGDLDVSRRGFLRVRFVDSPDWVEIGNSPAPIVVAAYATSDPDLMANARGDSHRGRAVAEIELLVSETPLPAKLYDLPGFGSPHPVHDEIARASIADADCFVYVTQATHTVSAAELELIRVVHTEYLNGKRAIWVVTGIDRASSVGVDDRPEWEATVARNNAYLGEHFKTSDGRPDSDFIGLGFLPVSPANEARGRWLIDHGEVAAGSRLVAASRMDTLRRALLTLVEDGTGQRHVVAVARTAYARIAPRYRELTQMLDAARLPIDQLGAQQTDLLRDLNGVELAIGSVRATLEVAARSRARTVADAFHGLNGPLHLALDEAIRNADLTKEEAANRIEVAKARVLRDWVVREGGPAQQAAREFTAFAQDALTSVRSVRHAHGAMDEIEEQWREVRIDDLGVPPSRRHSGGEPDPVQRAAVVVGALSPVANAAAIGLGIVSGGLAFVPGIVAAGAAATYAGIKHRSSKSTSLELLRSEWIRDLDTAASAYQNAFAAEFGKNLNRMIDRAEELLNERRAELARSLTLVDQRLADDDQNRNRRLINDLHPICASAEKLLARLQEISASGST